jgi:glutaredoxin
VASDQEAAKKMIEKSGQMGVPQIEINGKIIVGFDNEAIEEELKNIGG